MKIFLPTSDNTVVQMFTDNGDYEVPTLPEADLVVFVGGHDVSPMLYGQSQHYSTYASLERDMHEKKAFDYAVKLGIPMVGICRGGQFLNVMNGGSMHQDVDGHAIFGTHTATYLPTGEVFDVTSTHHQMMVPDHTGTVLVTASCAQVKLNKDLKYVNSDDADTEVVLYKDTRSLCFQPHPEYRSESCRKLFFRLLAEHLDMH